MGIPLKIFYLKFGQQGYVSKSGSNDPSLINAHCGTSSVHCVEHIYVITVFLFKLRGIIYSRFCQANVW